MHLQHSKTLRILHLEDSAADRELVADMLATDGFHCEFTYSKSRESFEAALSQVKFDLIFSDNSLPSFSGSEALVLARKLQPQTPFIFVSGSIQKDKSIENIKPGPSDYVLKDRLETLGPAVARVLHPGTASANENPPPQP